MQSFRINKGDKIICQEGIEYEFVEETMFLGIEYLSVIPKDGIECIAKHYVDLEATYKANFKGVIECFTMQTK